MRLIELLHHRLERTGCEWIEVMAQGVPAHIGTSTFGRASKEDPYAGFLPPAVAVPPDDDGRTLRAVVFVTEATPKGTDRSPQEYVRPLLVLSGGEYATVPFGRLHDMICNALRGQGDPDGHGRHSERGRRTRRPRALEP